ncbi:hypothetical protein BD769DRAFT_1385816 [Suillus cothurnatus]|nr:hypothetical protein BD769DRAFT_1385816 [Suillus cothurnatus]
MQSPTSVIPDTGQGLDDVEISLRNISIIEQVTAVDTHASSIHTASMHRTLHENGVVVRQCSQDEIRLTPTRITIMYAIGQLQHRTPYGALPSDVHARVAQIVELTEEQYRRWPGLGSDRTDIVSEAKMITPSVADLVDLFDAGGAFIFVERHGTDRPKFHITTASRIRETNEHFPTKPDAGALIAPDLLYNMPAMLADMVRSIANDVSVAIVYAYTEELANLLVSEAVKLDNAPYMSGYGRLMDSIMRNAAARAKSTVKQLDRVSWVQTSGTFKIYWEPGMSRPTQVQNSD